MRKINRDVFIRRTTLKKWPLSNLVNLVIVFVELLATWVNSSVNWFVSLGVAILETVKINV
jgi:hypothetical protein